jgi:hypothetical protein
MPKIASKKKVRTGTRAKKAPPRAALVQRLWQAADGQVRQLEGRLALEELEPAERERDARTMAVLVKTLRELNALDADSEKQDLKRTGTPEAAAPEANYDDPRDIDDFRRELARRIAALVPAADPDAAGGT